MRRSGDFTSTILSPLKTISKRGYSQIRTDTNITQQDLRYSPLRSTRVYGFGVAATGSIGVKKYVEPESKLVFYIYLFHFLENSLRKPRFSISVPTHLKYFSDKSIDIKSISCGYGFTTFIGSHFKHRRVVYGCGINSDGQLGYQVCIRY